jgi:hypothetical protein
MIFIYDGEMLTMIAERKLNISFSNFIVEVIDGSGTETKVYLEYHSLPKTNLGARRVKVHSSREDALRAALENCHKNVASLGDESFVITQPHHFWKK